MCLTYRPFEWTDADIESFVQIANAIEPDSWSVEEVWDHKKTLKPDEFFQREFVELAGKRIGVAFCGQGAGGMYDVTLRMLPSYRGVGYEKAIFNRAMQIVKERGAKSVAVSLRDDRKECITVLQQMGFECVMRDPVTELDLECFETNRFEATMSDVESQGIVLRSVAEMRTSGDYSIAKHRDLFNELMRDVPQVDPHRDRSIEELSMWLNDERFFSQGLIVARDGERWVGMSCTAPDFGRPHVAMTGLTGMVRTHRRRGIATAMKVAALEAARQAGVRTVQAQNEEHNPMLQLNLRLGFREVYAYLLYRKEL
jgi:mycothiol synthase